MKYWIFFALNIALLIPGHAFSFSMANMDFLYLPGEFVSQRTDFCRLYFPEQSSQYKAARLSWLAKNEKREGAFQKVLRDTGCDDGQCEGEAKSEKYRADMLKKRATGSLKRDMLELSKAGEEQATTLCKETLELLESDTLNLDALASMFQRKEK